MLNKLYSCLFIETGVSLSLTGTVFAVERERIDTKIISPILYKALSTQ